jgi:hypothetical protein
VEKVVVHVDDKTRSVWVKWYTEGKVRHMGSSWKVDCVDAAAERLKHLRYEEGIIHVVLNHLDVRFEFEEGFLLSEKRFNWCSEEGWGRNDDNVADKIKVNVCRKQEEHVAAI